MSAHGAMPASATQASCRRGISGVSTWLLAPVFAGTPLERATRATFVANGVASGAGTLWEVVQPGWALTRPGLVAFMLWNALLASLAILALIAFRRRLEWKFTGAVSPVA